MSIAWIPLDTWATSEQAMAVRNLWRAEPLNAVVDALKRVGLQPLLVGGVVRDLLLGRDNKDVDLIINCRARKLMKSGTRLARLTGATPVPLDAERGTLRLCFSPDSEVDLVALQGENLYQDLVRRDLRINAMAIDIEGGLADPFGGRGDLADGALREIREENFLDDPLRVVRALRFAAQLGFTLEGRTLENASRASRGLENVAGERINAELRKFFEHAEPKHIELLEQLGVVTAILFLPEYGWSLLRELTEHAPTGLEQGLAALFGPTLETSLRESLFLRLKLSRQTQRFLQHWWDGAKLLGEMESADLETVFALYKLSGSAFTALGRAAVCESFPGSLSKQQRCFILKESLGEGSLRRDPMPWSGHDVMEALGKESGPWLGETLRVLEKEWALGRVGSLPEALAVVEGR